MESSFAYLVPVYAAYGVIAVGLTVWLARALFKNGAVFLEGVFPNAPGLAEAVNRLLVIGFYLLNLGYACLLMKANPAGNAIAAIETLSWKLGLLLLSLGGMHFGNMLMLNKIRRRSEIAHLPPPVAPQFRVPAAAETA